MTTPAPDAAAAYKRALGAFPTGVAIITAEGASGVSGITVNSFASVSMQPRMVLWCLDDRSDRYAIFAEAEYWGLNILSAAQADLAARFATRGRHETSGVALEPLGGAHVLAGAAARFACRTAARHVMGDHLVIIGEVTAFDSAECDSLLYFRGAFGACPAGRAS